jgi:hypothetical protein
MVLGRGDDGPVHSTKLKSLLFSLLYQRCTSDSWDRLIAIQPWQESHVAEQFESPEQASHSLFGGTVDKVARSDCAARELLSQLIARSRNSTPVSLNT